MFRRFLSVNPEVYQVYNTDRSVQSFTPCNSALHRAVLNKADTSTGRLGVRRLYLLTYFAVPADAILQGAIYPIFSVMNPIRTLAVHLLNKNYLSFTFDLVLMPIKWAIAIPYIISYELFKICEIGLSLIGVHTLENVCLGKAAAKNYFSHRLDKFGDRSADGFLPGCRLENNLWTHAGFRPRKEKILNILSDPVIDRVEKERRVYHVYNTYSSIRLITPCNYLLHRAILEWMPDTKLGRIGTRFAYLLT